MSGEFGNRSGGGASRTLWKLIGVSLVVVLVAVGVAAIMTGTDPAAAFTPGDNGHPTSGALTDLKGRAGDVTLTFQRNAVLTCSENTAASFTFNLDYNITGAPLPAGSVIVVYLSPNNGAINNNADAN